MSPHHKTARRGPAGANTLSIIDVGPCYTCAYRNACWFLSLGWNQPDHLGSGRSDFKEPMPCGVRRRTIGLPQQTSSRRRKMPSRGERLRKSIRKSSPGFNQAEKNG